MDNVEKVGVFLILFMLVFVSAVMIHTSKQNNAEVAECAPTDLFVWPRGIKTRVYLCPPDDTAPQGDV